MASFKLQKDVLLKNHTTFRIGGPAEQFASVGSVEELKAAIKHAHSSGVPFLVLGGGSNVLPDDEGFRGLVIKNDIKGVEWGDGAGERVVRAYGGEDWDEFAAAALARGLYGLENLSGIPGSVGAAPVQNIGAYGAEVKDVIKWVEALDVHTLETRTFENVDCAFGYRDSFFKTREGGRYVITRAAFVLREDGALDLGYKDLREYFANATREPTLEEVRRAVLAIRARKFPDLSKYGCAGSFFKNPIVPREKYLALKQSCPELPAFETADGRVKLSAAWLIDKICGLKGYRGENCGVHESQPLVLVNYGAATSREIKALAEKVRASVEERTGILLESEVHVL